MRTPSLSVTTLSLLLSAALPAGTQTVASDTPAVGRISGEVIEARTGVPLAAVLVHVQATRQRAFSDHQGRFEILDVPAGPHTLIVSVVGFGLVRRNVAVVAGEISTLTIPVAGGASTYVEDVTVTADRFRLAEAAAPSQTVLGSRELLALRGVMADDPFRAVQALPGVTTGDDFRGEFAIRGLGPEHIGISVDGVDSPLLFHTVRAVHETGSLALINSDILDEAVLLAGPHPQKLGSHLGSRLNFNTRDGSRAGFAARALVSGSAATGVFEGPIGSGKRGAWIVAARRSYVDWLLDRIDPNLDGTFGFTDVQGSVSYDLMNRHQVWVGFIGGRSQLKEQDDIPSMNSLARGRDRTAIGNLRWRATLSPRAILNQQMYIVHSRYENTVADRRAREQGWDRDVTWRGAIDWRPSAAHTLELGGQAQSLRARRIDRRFTSATSAITFVDATIATSGGAAYLSYKWAPSPALTISPGGRVEHWSVIGAGRASPWLLAEWHVANATRLRAGFAVQYQAPAIDRALFARPDDRLAPEQARTWEIGVERLIGESWRGRISAFRRRDRDRLRVKNAEFRFVNSRLVRPGAAYVANTLRGEGRGVDLTVERRSVNGFSGWLSYSWGHATMTDVSGTITGSPSSVIPTETYDADYDQRHTVNIYSAYRWSGRTSVSARFRYGSNFPNPGYFEPRGAVFAIGAERNRLRLPVYSRLDIRADRTFTYRKRRLTLFAEVINALDHENERADGPSFNPVTGEVWNLTGRVFPRLPSAGMLFEF